MLGSVQIVPFHRPPKKSWIEGMEKKKRLRIDLTRDEDDDIEEEKFQEYVSDDSSESSEDSGFDMMQHIADLLPGDLVDGHKPSKQANMSHLEDLRVVAKKNDRVGIFRRFYRFIQRKRAEERERRKHYIIREWEEKIKEYDENQKQAILDRMEAHRKEVLLEKHRSEQRRIRNSRKVHTINILMKLNVVVTSYLLNTLTQPHTQKVERSSQIEQFTADLDRRDKEAKVMQYYCTNLTNWAIEGHDRWALRTTTVLLLLTLSYMYLLLCLLSTNRRDREVIEAKQLADKLAAEKKAADKLARHKQEIADDAQILEDDKRITKEVETIMIRYGTVEYEPELDKSHDEKLDNIFEQHKKSKSNQGQAKLTVGDDENYMKINLKQDLDLVYLKKKLKKNAHRRTASVPTPFAQDLSGTGQILTLKAQGIGETGALSLAAELTRGACPMLETLNLNKCEVRSDGIGRLFQGIKAANLLSLRRLQLRGNFIRARGLEYMQEIYPSGVFMNLAVLDLSDNELGDDGVTVLVNIMLQGHMGSLVELNLQHNSITDHGFRKIVSVLKSLRDAKCPALRRVQLENNLVSAQARRANSPYPDFFSM